MPKNKTKVPVAWRNPFYKVRGSLPSGPMVKSKKAKRKQDKQSFQKRVKSGNYDDCRCVGLDHRDSQHFRNHLAL